MKKLIPLLSIFYCSLFTLHAQSWDTVGQGLRVPFGQSQGVFAQQVYNGQLYVGGFFNQAENRPVRSAAIWNGSIWANWANGVSGAIGALCLYNGQLIAGGGFDSAGSIGAQNVVSWNGSSWDSLGSGVSGHLAVINALCVYNGDLIAGGCFDKAGGTSDTDLAAWNGSSWVPFVHALGFGHRLYSNTVNALCVYNGELYVGGYFDSIAGIAANNIAKWNGTSWSAVGKGVSMRTPNPYGVYALCVYNGELYVGGYFDSAGGQVIPSIAKWNGSLWSKVGTGIPQTRNTYGVESFCVYDSTLCVGGRFDSAGGKLVNNIAYWNGSTWGAFGLGTAMSGDVYSICPYHSSLYAGGDFYKAGGMVVNNIAQWTGPLLSVNELSAANADCRIYPNPNHGVFTLQMNSKKLKVNSVVEIYNMLGEKIVPSFVIRNSQFVINIGTQPAGVYLYRIVDENSTLIYSGKLVIE